MRISLDPKIFPINLDTEPPIVNSFFVFILVVVSRIGSVREEKMENSFWARELCTLFIARHSLLAIVLIRWTAHAIDCLQVQDRYDRWKWQRLTDRQTDRQTARSSRGREATWISSGMRRAEDKRQDNTATRPVTKGLVAKGAPGLTKPPPSAPPFHASPIRLALSVGGIRS